METKTSTGNIEVALSYFGRIATLVLAAVIAAWPDFRQWG